MAASGLLIEGSSDSGKTTLLSLLAGVVKADQGSLPIPGQSLERMSAVKRDHFRADHVGYVFQKRVNVLTTMTPIRPR
jgi:putative ABC transport system ATP-binding protein